MSKAREILSVLAHKIHEGETYTFMKDWGLGSGTIVFKDGSHSHFGADIEDDERKAIDDFIEGLHEVMVCNRGLSPFKQEED